MSHHSRSGVLALAIVVSALAQPSTVPGNPLTISATSNISRGCGTAISASALQQDLVSQLRAAGITVSKVHSARLSADVDCLPVAANERNIAVAIHQCLALSQVVSLPAEGRDATIATTWRKCQSYTCGSGQCAVLTRTGLRDLTNTYIADSKERVSARESAAPTPPAREVSKLAQFIVTVPKPELTQVIFYAIYVLACIAVLVRWRFLRQAH